MNLKRIVDMTNLRWKIFNDKYENFFENLVTTDSLYSITFTKT